MHPMRALRTNLSTLSLAVILLSADRFSEAVTQTDKACVRITVELPMVLER
jgi:hypothetical protein